jgi:hypothetical protein
VPTVGIRDIVLPLFAALVVGAAAAMVSGDFGWPWVVASIVVAGFLIAFIGLASWWRRSSLKSRGFEPIPLSEEDQPPPLSQFLPFPFKSVRLTVALLGILWLAVLGTVGLVLENFWLVAVGVFLAFWTAVAWLSMWAFRRKHLRKMGMRW